MTTVKQHKRSYANYVGALGENPAATPANTAVPTIAGTAQVGATLTAADGTWTGNIAPGFTYEWTVGGVVVSSVDRTYIPVAGDIGKAVSVAVTAVNHAGAASATSIDTAVVITNVPVNTAVPTISGTAKVGETLTATDGTWTGFPVPEFTYQWAAGVTDIVGATDATYEPVVDDVGETLTVTVTGTNTAGTDSASSVATAAVVGA